MNLQECLNKLARGKLSNLSISKNGEIIEDAVPQVVDAVNEALSRLYTIFPVKEKAVLVEIEEGKTDYVLSSEHSWRNRKGDGDLWDHWDFYIIDTPENPFIMLWCGNVPVVLRFARGWSRRGTESRFMPALA